MKHKSPLRYPGGKSKLFPFMADLIQNNFVNQPTYVEPFAGGFGLGILLLQNHCVDSVMINDFDFAIYAIWMCITSEELHNNFINLIENTPVTIEQWHIQKYIYLNQDDYNLVEIGFATFFLNRTNISGIIKANPIGGIKQNSSYNIDYRFNKTNLIKLINDIYEFRDRIIVSNENAQEFIQRIDNHYDNLFIYLDPPYVKKGPQLYKNCFDEQMHRELANQVFQLENKWFVSYDSYDLIRELYQNFEIEEFKLKYSISQTSKTGHEIAIYSHNLAKVNSIESYLKTKNRKRTKKQVAVAV